MTRPAGKNRREPPAQSPSNQASSEAVVILIEQLLSVSEQIFSLCREGIEHHAQSLNQLMLERGRLIDLAHALPLSDPLPAALQQADFQAKLDRLAELDQELGQQLQLAMQQVQAQLGTCKSSRQVINHYRVPGPDNQHTRSSQA